MTELLWNVAYFAGTVLASVSFGAFIGNAANKHRCAYLERDNKRLNELLMQAANLGKENKQLRKALEDLCKHGETYMKYHTEKFYDGRPPPLGMSPELAKTRALLENR